MTETHVHTHTHTHTHTHAHTLHKKHKSITTTNNGVEMQRVREMGKINGRLRSSPNKQKLLAGTTFP